MSIDVKAAIRVVASNNIVLEFTPDVLQALMLKHQSEPEGPVTPIISADNIAVTTDEKKTIRSLPSYSGGGCGGIDGLRPAHLLDLVDVSTTEAGLHLRRSITNLTAPFFIESRRFEEERWRHSTGTGRAVSHELLSIQLGVRGSQRRA